ncbi:anti-sigma factor RsbA family regulatory protein [Amycolatopsis nigrescens]|uniref:anti-sigma factor RsbA family regulatory protein n=1 Tax=Amycolatopsis nigrescens TaxID=381445 RepID=UPI0003606A70|nr:anti-sigma factor RsbA family regulatory protein [Amycolatopsis nigrescens]
MTTDTTGRFLHPAWFYRGKDEYLAGVVPFLREGLAAGEPAAAAVPGPNLELLRDALGEDTERVQLLDMAEVGRNPGRIIPGVLRAFADRHPGRPVRIVGEPIWPSRTEQEYPACAQHEALINAAFAGRAASILCPYDVEGLTAGVLDDAAATHPVLWDLNGRRNSEKYAPDQVIATFNRPLPAPPPDTVVFRFDLQKATQARRFALERARRLGLAEDRLPDLELIVAELVANSVMHGGGAGTVGLWAEPDHLVCEVRDSGHLTDRLAGRRPAAPTQLGGRGLLLVNQLARLVRTHTTADGTTVRLHV